MNYYIIGYKNKPIGESGESCKSEYDFKDACDLCGTGANLIKDLRVKGFSKINKDFFETLDGDFIISKRIYETIKQDQPSFELKPVIDSKNNKLDFYHLNPSKVLPKFENKSKGYIVENQCEKCNRNGFTSSKKLTRSGASWKKVRLLFLIKSTTLPIKRSTR